MTTLWTPAYTKTGLWLDAADSNTITLISGLVSRWADKSGEGCHVDQPTSSYRPSVEAAALNGLNAIYFPPGRALGRTSTDVARNADRVIVVALRRIREPTRSSQFFATSKLGMNNLSSGFPSAFARRGNSGATYSAVSADPTTAGFALHTVYADYVANTVAIGINGRVDTGAGIAGSGPTEDTDTTLVIGGNVAAYASPQSFNNANMAGDVGEITLAYSMDDVARLEGYMAHRWGIASALHVSHPYKSAPPLLGAIAGNAIVQGGVAVDLVSVHDHATKALVATTVPAGNGDWSVSVMDGSYDISYWADGCRPVTHGPYTVTAE